MTNVLNQYIESAYNVDIDNLNLNEINLERDKDRKSVERYYEKKLDNIISNNKEIEDTNNKLTELLSKDLSEMEYKISKIVNKIRGAILVERKTTSTIYSTIIPITKQYTNENKTTAIIKDDVIFGISDTKIDKEYINILNINNISFKNLNIKKLNKTKLEDLVISNLNHNTLAFEFTINLTNLVNNNSALILDLKDYAILEVYINNSMYKEKTLTNYLSIPIDSTTNTVTIRSYPTIHKSTDLHINLLGITEFIYQDETVFETKDIAINESFSNMILDTCDNNSDTNIDIKYYIAINGKEYERINTTHSFKNKDNTIQSVIGLSKDSELSLLQISGTKRSEGDIQYVLPDETQNYINYELEVYLRNTNKIKKQTLWLLSSQDTILFKSYLTEGKVFLDDIEITEDDFLIPKGLRKITLIDNYNYNYLEKVLGETNIFSNKILKPVLKKNDFKYVSLNSVELLESNNSIDIEDIYIKNLKRQVYVSTIKLKAELNSIDKKTVPYISRFLIRGI